MPKVTIDGIEYNSRICRIMKGAIALQFLEVQMGKIRSEIAVYQTARIYIAALKPELEKNQ